MREITTDYLVIGSGVAGLLAALRLSVHGNVILITKGDLKHSNSSRAQGGIAVSISPEDSTEHHVMDTIDCGCGLCDARSVETIVHGGQDVLAQLIDLGVPFNRNGDGTLALGREGLHSRSRIVHAHGDATGMAITNALIDTVIENKNITVYDDTFVENLIVRNGICYGALVFHQKDDMAVFARSTVLATGGSGQVYEHTTNVLLSTGDGFALAYRAGAELMDMEFIQFHPTALAKQHNPMALISEAVRGEGAVLVDQDGRRFMFEYHPWADLAPRDVVSRAIFNEMGQGRNVFLDATHIGSRFSARFPNIYHSCTTSAIDPAHQPIPVSPAAHFIMGGVRTDHTGRTSIARLYACGEVACSGAHGANRLASNSLLEGLVFAVKAADDIASADAHEADLPSYVFDDLKPSYPPLCYEISAEALLEQPAVKKLKRIMWENAGIVRTKVGLQKAERQLNQIKEECEYVHPVIDNLFTTALLIVRSALYREESRGAHYRSDFPATLEQWSNKRSLWRWAQ